MKNSFRLTFRPGDDDEPLRLRVDDPDFGMEGETGSTKTPRSDKSTSDASMNADKFIIEANLMNNRVKQEVDEIMQKFDKNEDDMLHFEEARDYIMRWGKEVLKMKPNEKMIVEIFQDINSNRDGYITRKDLYNHI